MRSSSLRRWGSVDALSECKRGSFFFWQARALHAYVPTPTDEDQSLTFLAFAKGAIIDVIEMHESGWWEGCCK